MARLLNENGMICLAALIAPDATVRERAAELIGHDRFVTVYCEAPLETCQARDPRGHYASAAQGDMPRLPGAGASYEVPAQPDLVLHTGESSPEECVEQVLALLRDRRFIR